MFGKREVLVVRKNMRRSCEKMWVSGEEMQNGDKFNYLEVMIGTDGGMGEEVAHMLLERRRVWGTMA